MCPDGSVVLLKIFSFPDEMMKKGQARTGSVFVAVAKGGSSRRRGSGAVGMGFEKPEKRVAVFEVTREVVQRYSTA